MSIFGIVTIYSGPVVVSVFLGVGGQLLEHYSAAVYHWLILTYLCLLSDDDTTIWMCAQKLTDASLIYRTEPETKNRKEKN